MSLRRVDGVEVTVCTTQVLEQVSGSADHRKECDKLIERHVEKYHLFKKLVDGAFHADHRFQLAMKEVTHTDRSHTPTYQPALTGYVHHQAFEQIVNKDIVVKPATDKKPARTISTAELMADYADHLLKNKMKLTT